MAVYEHTYKPYAGALTPDWSRFLVIPRHAFHDVFKSKLFIVFFVACFIPLLIEAVLIYLHHNVTALAIFRLNAKELLPIDASFFEFWVNFQGGFAFFVALLVGPPLVSKDLRNNALPLFLCRPFSRTEYVLGKMSVLLILLSVITWVPQLLLFFFQSYLEGWSWFVQNLSLASAILMSTLVWILLLSLLTQAISAIVKWRVVASATLLGLLLIPSVFGEIFNQLFMTRWGHIVSIGASVKSVTSGLFGTFVRNTGNITIRDFDGSVLRQIVMNEPPLWCSWAALFVVCAVCLALLSWKVKAYEVIK